MCVLCQAQQATGFAQFASSTGTGHIQYGSGSVATSSGAGVTNIDALISGYKWASSTLSFALPTVATALPGYNTAYDETDSFAAVTGALATGIRMAMAHISAYTGLLITETTNISTANLLVGRTGQTSTAHAYLPDGYFKGGDVWISTSSDFDAPSRGNYAYATALHEIGHALGLKHAHTYIGGVGASEDDVGIIALPVAANRDSLEFTVMTYRSYVGQDLAVFDYYTNETASFPQTLMMYDIAALQKMYGADFNTNATDSVYTFSVTTGEMSTNGVAEGVLAGNRIFRTIWDGGGVDTYDFSNFGSNQTIDLTPGGWSLMASAQRADLGSGNFARGNVFNALQFGTDTRSLIENAIGGTGNDSILGNAADNRLTGGAGNDTLTGNGGSDTLIGGVGDDVYILNLDYSNVFEGANEGQDTVFTDLPSYMIPNNIEFLYGTKQGSQQLYGNESVNYIISSNFSDILVLGDGNDGGTSNGGNDYIYCGNGDDIASGGNGVDVILGEEGNDKLNGGIDQDYIYGGNGKDLIYGGDGVDVLLGETGSDTIFGDQGGDYLYGGEGNNVFYGGEGNDIIVGGVDDETAYGDDGQDYFYMNSGNDYMIGGLGVDVMLGESGNDIFDGGEDVDYIFLGSGIDTVIINNRSDSDVVNDFIPQSGDIIRFEGTNLKNFTDLQKNLYDYGSFIIIQASSTAAIWLIGVTPAQLKESDFLFL
jgi:serralysin